MPAKIVDKDIRPAPGDLRIVQAFLNTVNHESRVDLLSSPRALADWLSAQGLAGPEVEFDAADLERTLTVREGWRVWLRSSPMASPELCERLDRLLTPIELRPKHHPDGALQLVPTGGGVAGALGRLSAILMAAQHEKTWPRFKICSNPDCRSAFYDYSNNRSNKWCTRRCGNRISARLSRRRKRRS